MPYLRHALNLFLLLTVLALAFPSVASQDNSKADDSTSQSDRSDDQSSDTVTLNDFIFEHSSVLLNQIPREICLEAVSPAPASRRTLPLVREPSVRPHIFISGGGLMPRAPAPV